MRWPTSRSIALGSVAFVGLVTLVTFQATSRAEPRPPSPLASEAEPTEARHGPVWVPEVVSAPGLPLQCSDGTWTWTWTRTRTRAVVRGGCARHGGIAY